MSENRSEKRQMGKFVKAARELGCDEDESAFEEKLRHIVKQKPKPAEKAKGRKSEASE